MLIDSETYRSNIFITCYKQLLDISQHIGVEERPINFQLSLIVHTLLIDSGKRINQMYLLHYYRYKQMLDISQHIGVEERPIHFQLSLYPHLFRVPWGLGPQPSVLRDYTIHNLNYIHLLYLGILRNCLACRGHQVVWGTLSWRARLPQYWLCQRYA